MEIINKFTRQILDRISVERKIKISNFALDIENFFIMTTNNKRMEIIYSRKYIRKYIFSQKLSIRTTNLRLRYLKNLSIEYQEFCFYYQNSKRLNLKE